MQKKFSDIANQLSRWGAWCNQIGFTSVCGMAVSMTFSRALFNLFALLVVVAWVLTGRFRHLLIETRQSPIAVVCMMLYALILMGVFYSPATPAQAWDQAATYFKLLLIPLMASFVDTPARTRTLWLSAMAGLLILLLAYVADLWVDIPGSLSAKTQTIGVFNNHIVEGFSMTVLALIMTTWSSLSMKQHKHAMALMLGLVAAVSLYCVLFLNPGRGAQLAMLTGMAVLAFLLIPGKFRWLGGAAVVLGILVIAAQSSMVTQRFEMALAEARSAETQKQTSVGLRINAWKAGLSLWQESPVMGRGTGSYQHLMFTEKSEMVGGCENNPVCLQPHSQYVLFLAEQGLVGLLLFVVLLGALVWPALKSPQIQTNLSAAFACAFAVHSAFDSGLRMGTQMFVFMVLTVALAAAVRLQWPDNGSHAAAH
jgi:O-antigen ligase